MRALEDKKPIKLLLASRASVIGKKEAGAQSTWGKGKEEWAPVNS
jgi:hypothetical protein